MKVDLHRWLAGMTCAAFSIAANYAFGWYGVAVLWAWWLRGIWWPPFWRWLRAP